MSLPEICQLIAEQKELYVKIDHSSGGYYSFNIYYLENGALYYRLDDEHELYMCDSIFEYHESFPVVEITQQNFHKYDDLIQFYMENVVYSYIGNLFN
jgi:hypothetical protein